MIDTNDKLPVWWLVKSANLPRNQLVPLLRRLGLPVDIDPEDAEVYTSRSEFRALLFDVAGNE